MSLRAALRQTTARLAEAGVASPGADAAVLAAHALGVEVGEMHRQALLGAPAPPGLTELVQRRAQRVPLQHLTGVAHFRRVSLRVGPGVFVPRPETEVLVEHALAALAPVLAAGRAPIVVDLCTGSGAIALAVADECPSARVVAVELSADALEYAATNVSNVAGSRVELRADDAVQACPDLVGTVDVVATNPPYVPDDGVPIDPEVRDHDPAMALYGGGDGLDLPMRIVARAARLLRPGGTLLMEHGERQGADIAARLAAQGDWADIADQPDLTGRPRVMRAVHAGGGPGAPGEAGMAPGQRG